MARLANAALAIVAIEKVSDYLLNPDNPQNRGKAEFFARFGFGRNDGQRLREALLADAADREMIDIKVTAYGRVVKLRCNLASPDGRDPCITSTWQFDLGGDRPRLLTAI